MEEVSFLSIYLTKEESSFNDGVNHYEFYKKNIAIIPPDVYCMVYDYNVSYDFSYWLKKNLCAVYVPTDTMNRYDSIFKKLNKLLEEGTEEEKKEQRLNVIAQKYKDLP